jgi:ribosome modulation factor
MPDPAKAASDIFQTGMDARGKGEPATAFPYPDESGEREQWLEGWHDPDQAEPEELGFA